jgi:hypothetical protein
VLRSDPLLATLAGKTDPTGSDRRRQEDRGKALAGKSTLNRLELGAQTQDRYRKISLDEQAVDRFLVEVFLSAHETAPESIVLDLDATDDPVHGEQEGRFFHGYYGGYCYLPLYIFCGSHLLCARLRPSDRDASAGARGEVERIAGQIRDRWPEVKIILRGDSGFAREELMAWCEQHGVDYVFGLARNARLQRILGPDLAQAKTLAETSGKAERRYRDFSYQTRKSWSQTRRVIGKAEHLPKGANPRFVVTSLSPELWGPAPLYEQLYCARGEMENRIKEQQLCLFADRTSSHWMKSNQLRLWFSSVAYILLSELRRLGLAGTDLAHARCDTIRIKLLKIGASSGERPPSLRQFVEFLSLRGAVYPGDPSPQSGSARRRLIVVVRPSVLLPSTGRGVSAHLVCARVTAKTQTPCALLPPPEPLGAYLTPTRLPTRPPGGTQDDLGEPARPPR